MDSYAYGDELLNTLLKFCIDQNKQIYNLNEFLVVEAFKKNHPTTILNTLSNAKSLFDVNKSIVQISIKVIKLIR